MLPLEVVAVKGLVLVVLAAVAGACGGSTAAAARPAAPPSTPVPPLLSAAADPQLGQILVDAQGHTLYFFVPEEGSKIVCTGDCTTAWQPLVVPGHVQPSSAVALPGTLDATVRPEGMRQVLYDGWPLYTYAMDRRPGDKLGSGAGGQWFVAMAAGESTPTPAPPPTPVPTAAPPPPAPAPAPPPTMRPVPRPFNDGDADNRGGPNDGDGNG